MNFKISFIFLCLLNLLIACTRNDSLTHYYSFEIENKKYKIDTCCGTYNNGTILYFDKSKYYKLKIVLDTNNHQRISGIKYYLLTQDGNYNLQQNLILNKENQAYYPPSQFVFFTLDSLNKKYILSMHTNYYDRFNCLINKDTMFSVNGSIEVSALTDETEFLCYCSKTVKTDSGVGVYNQKISLNAGLLRRIIAE